MTKREREARKQWQALNRRIARADAAARAARQARLDFVEGHFKKRPLSLAVRTKLAGHVHGGGALCCEAGRKFLDGLVDPIWAEALNRWAYHALGCRGMSMDRIHEYVEKVEKVVADPKALAEHIEL